MLSSLSYAYWLFVYSLLFSVQVLCLFFLLRVFCLFVLSLFPYVLQFYHHLWRRLSLLKLLWWPHWKSFDHVYVGLFLYSLFYSIDLFVCDWFLYAQHSVKDPINAQWMEGHNSEIREERRQQNLCWAILRNSVFKTATEGTSLVAQWLKIHLPTQGTRVRALGWEDPTCRRATKPVRYNYWACALEPASHNYWAHMLQLLKAAHLEPVLCNKRSHRNEKPAHCNEE